MSPLDIEVLIHYNSSATQHPRIHAPAVQETIKKFMKDGILEPDEVETHIHRTTARGRALLKVICATPYPEPVWLDGNGEVICGYPG